MTPSTAPWRTIPCHSEYPASATRIRVRSGLYSSHSPGRDGGAGRSIATSVLAPIICAVIALLSEGADRCDSTIEMTNRTANIRSDCHRKIVCVNGMTPVMSMTGFGRLAALACSWAADELRPNAQVRSEEHTSELQSHLNLVCRLLLEKKKSQLAQRERISSYTSQKR